MIPWTTKKSSRLHFVEMGIVRTRSRKTVLGIKSERKMRIIHSQCSRESMYYDRYSDAFSDEITDRIKIQIKVDLLGYSKLHRT